MALGREFIVASLALNIVVLARAVEQRIDDVAHEAVLTSNSALSCGRQCLTGFLT